MREGRVWEARTEADGGGEEERKVLCERRGSRGLSMEGLPREARLVRRANGSALGRVGR